MKLLRVLCLSLCVMLLTACSDKPPIVITNEVPPSLLVAVPAPERPNVNTGNNKRDFQNGTSYIRKLEDALKKNIAKIEGIADLITRTQGKQSTNKQK